MQDERGTVTASGPAAIPLPAVAGIELAATSAGIYRRRRPDLCLMRIAPGASAAAVFTRNACAAAPVLIARRHLQVAAPRYLLINAGNANAGTGTRGLADALRLCEGVASLGGCPVEQVLPFSTGVIGEYLPVDAVLAVLPALHEALRADGWQDCGRAIMTTDTTLKAATRRFDTSAGAVTLTGIAKGAGMIHPDMATLLVFIGTDARVPRDVLQQALRQAVDGSFNRICVDGDTSTNDAVIVLASGAGAALDDAGDQRRFATALAEACTALAQAVVRDGEGATKFITLVIEQGGTTEECLAVGRAIATSPLVKTAFFASDPNWGRILAAVGRAGVAGLDPSRVDIFLDEVQIVQGGARAVSYAEEAGAAVMRQPDIGVRVRLGRGMASATLWTCDLSDAYVRINADYRS
jgi:glutamate N-acetyltransferase/amino-acid N-acetyltransferase